jgi:hypothetical protein
MLVSAAVYLYQVGTMENQNSGPGPQDFADSISTIAPQKEVGNCIAPAIASPHAASWDFFAAEEASPRRAHGDFFDCAPARAEKQPSPETVVHPANSNSPSADFMSLPPASAQEHEGQPDSVDVAFVITNFAGFPSLPPGNSECTAATIETNVTVDCLIPAARRVSVTPPSHVRPDWTGMAKPDAAAVMPEAPAQTASQENLRKLALLRESLRAFTTPTAAQSTPRLVQSENDPFCDHSPLSFANQQSQGSSLFAQATRQLSL